MENVVETNAQAIPADTLADIYIKIRDKRAELQEQFEQEDATLNEQMELLVDQMLALCLDQYAVTI